MVEKKIDWKKKLTTEQYHILREKGTELPFTGKLLHNKKTGMYHCVGCNAALFSSDTKFDSGCGWPSFFAAHGDHIVYKEDHSHFMHRIEVQCKNCGGHLGHVFDDGPKPTGKRFCINSLALTFKEEKKKKSI